MVNVAFGDIAKSYPGHSLGEFSWILNSYAIVYAALLIPLGRWADRIGTSAPSSPASHCSPSPAPPALSVRHCGHWWHSASFRQ
ncbi:hypothetical protein QV65_08130, partial [Rhodococcus erythropolis]